MKWLLLSLAAVALLLDFGARLVPGLPTGWPASACAVAMLFVFWRARAQTRSAVLPAPDAEVPDSAAAERRTIDGLGAMADAEGVCIAVSSELAEALGVPAQDLVGLPIAEAFGVALTSSVTAAMQAAREAEAPVREDAALADLVKQGVTLVKLAPAQRAVFRAAVQPVWDKWTSAIGPDIVAAAEAAAAAAVVPAPRAAP